MTIFDSPVVILANGAARCEIAPHAGGAIAGFWWEQEGERVDWLRPAGPGAVPRGDAQQMGCFPMIPYGNRIRGGRFLFCGREVVEEPAAPGASHAADGHGWRRRWAVVERDDHHLTLVYEHAPDAWPWPYRARQRFVLTPEALSVTLEIENLSDGLMPAGLGFHPFFPRTPDAVLEADASGVWLTDEEALPTERTAVPAQWNLSAGKRVADLALDHVFTGWRGEARIVWPERGASLTLNAAPPLMSFLAVETPQDRDFFCIEPVSHCADAINLAREGMADTGLRVLAPNVSRATTMVLRPVLH